MAFVKYVGLGVAVGSGAYYYWYWKVEANVKKGSYYEKSLNLLRGYQPAKDILGEKIVPLKMEIADEFNVLNDKVAKLAIPVVGKKGTGTLYTWSTKPENASDWQVDQLDIEITNPKNVRWTFYRLQDQQQTKSKTS